MHVYGMTVFIASSYKHRLGGLRVFRENNPLSCLVRRIFVHKFTQWGKASCGLKKLKNSSHFGKGASAPYIINNQKNCTASSTEST